MGLASLGRVVYLSEIIGRKLVAYDEPFALRRSLGLILCGVVVE
jgi:hypothetical protein